MKYFRTFPKIAVYNPDKSITVASNIMRRIEINPALFEQSILFYAYSYQDSDKPEIISNKYYGDSYRYWIFFFANQIFDPQWDLPLEPNLFSSYIKDKYLAAAEEASEDVNTYIKTSNNAFLLTRTSYDSSTQQTTTDVFNIDQDTYNTLPTSPVEEKIYFDDGSYTYIVSTKSIQKVYDYEVEQNEKKRPVILINSTYAPALEKNFKILMRQ